MFKNNIEDDFFKELFAYELEDQRGMVKRLDDQIKENGVKSPFGESIKNNTQNSANKSGINDQSGKPYQIIVEKNNKNKENVQVQFSSTNKDLFIESDLDNFCNGRYASLKDENCEKIAEILDKDNNYIFGFIEATIASLKDNICIKQAESLINKVNDENFVLDSDYNKIISKLDNNDKKELNSYVSKNDIILISSSKKKEIEYKLDYIKNFKEYKTADINGLKNRIASVDMIKNDIKYLKNKFKKDSILKNIILE
jgi:hypothetical protein